MAKEFNFSMLYGTKLLYDLSQSSGYTPSSAIFELIDNSLDSNSTNIHITFKGKKFSIEDNGDGMCNEELYESFFKVGNNKVMTKAKSKSYGAFNIGAKTALNYLIGISEDKNVQINSKSDGSMYAYAVWDVLDNENIKIGFHTKEEGGKSLKVGKCGYETGMSIKCATSRRIAINELITNIGVTYCWAINKGVNIYVNDMKVQAIDPIYRENEVAKSLGLIETKHFSDGVDVTILNATESFENKLLPTKPNAYDFPETTRGRKSQKEEKSKLRCSTKSGIYIRTNGRYYALGGNYTQIMGVTTHASMDGIRVEVTLPKEMWDDVEMTWNKGTRFKKFTEIPKLKDVVKYISTITNDLRLNKAKDANKHHMNYKHLVVANSKSESRDLFTYKNGQVKLNFAYCKNSSKAVKDSIGAMADATLDACEKTEYTILALLDSWNNALSKTHSAREIGKAV